ncbi:MAG: hypothetical protein U0805_14335 [Pirellulales bacterium]
MRHIFGISVLLIAIVTASCVVKGSASDPATPPALTWIRTADGWERYGTWNLPAPQRPTLHPGIVAVGQVLVSMWALIVFHRDESQDTSETA